jgi:hypothetical protein
MRANLEEALMWLIVVVMLVAVVIGCYHGVTAT